MRFCWLFGTVSTHVSAELVAIIFCVQVSRLVYDRVDRNYAKSVTKTGQSQGWEKGEEALFRLMGNSKGSLLSWPSWPSTRQANQFI